jgi:hypothetical protein
MNEFLNPKSMVTPGVAGGVLTFLVNGLAQPFPEFEARYLALALSFVIGAIVILSAATMKVAERVAYWVLNSLVIFVVGFGANHLGREATQASEEGIGRAPFVSSLIPSAYAQEPKPAPVTPAPSQADAEKKAMPGAQPQNAKPEPDQSKAAKAHEKDAKPAPGAFFKKW